MNRSKLTDFCVSLLLFIGEESLGKKVYIRYTCIILVFIGIKKYIVGLIIKTSSDTLTLEKEKVYLGKLNMILVQVRIEHKCLWFEN